MMWKQAVQYGLVYWVFLLFRPSFQSMQLTVQAVKSDINGQGSLGQVRLHHLILFPKIEKTS